MLSFIGRFVLLSYLYQDTGFNQGLRGGKKNVLSCVVCMFCWNHLQITASVSYWCPCLIGKFKITAYTYVLLILSFAKQMNLCIPKIAPNHIFCNCTTITATFCNPSSLSTCFLKLIIQNWGHISKLQPQHTQTSRKIACLWYSPLPVMYQASQW